MGAIFFIMLILKTNPVGVDVPVDRLQKLLYNGIAGIDPVTWVANGYESYHRAYKNENNEGTSGLRPEVYDANNEYKEVFFDDNFSATSFFLADNTLNSPDGHLYQTEISIIFQLRLNELYPAITHRADEEAHNEVLVKLENNPWSYTVSQVITGIPQVYEDLNVDKVRYDDMHPKHVFMVKMSIEYSQDC